MAKSHKLLARRNPITRDFTVILLVTASAFRSPPPRRSRCRGAVQVLRRSPAHSDRLSGQYPELLGNLVQMGNRRARIIPDIFTWPGSRVPGDLTLLRGRRGT